MVHVCKGICLERKATKRSKGISRYLQGHKYCTYPCAQFIIWDGLYCPCCGTRLRGRPERKIFRERFNEATKSSLQISDSVLIS